MRARTFGVRQPSAAFAPTARQFAVAAIAILLAGCAVGPDYHKPAAFTSQPVPQAFDLGASTNTADWKSAEPSAHLNRGAWWEIFGDPELSRLETLANSENQQLAGALARFEQARALVEITRSDLFPQVTLAPGMTHQHTSANEFDNGKTKGVSHTYNNFTFPLEASWEVDLWGRVRRRVEAAKAQLTASSDDLESLKLSIQSEIATDYFTLRALDAEHELLEQAVEGFRRSLELTQNRRKGGIVSDLDVSQAETQLTATQAQLPVVEFQRIKLRHALATLCGQPATAFALNSTKTDLAATPVVPLYLPSELLERRPDVAAAERRMAAANAEVGVAQGAFYPRVVFHGLAGFQSINAGTLFDWPSRLWAVGPSLDLPIFTGGRNRAQLASARAAYDQDVAAYRQTVLAAFQEVEDQLAAQQLLSAQLQAEAAALASARRTLEIANNRYKAGLVTYLEVATAQEAELIRERAVIQLEGEKLVANVALIRSLGGGWHAGSEGLAASLKH